MPHVCQPLAINPFHRLLAARRAIDMEPLRIVIARERHDLVFGERCGAAIDDAARQ